MKKYLFSLLILFTLSLLSCDYVKKSENLKSEITTDTITKLCCNQSNDTIIYSDTIYSVVDKMPEFKGGKDAMMQYISDNISYPDSCRINGIEGIVYVEFVVCEDGSISNVDIIRGVDVYLDSESIRVVQNMPKWIPGSQNNKVVNTKMALPIKFSLN